MRRITLIGLVALALTVVGATAAAIAINSNRNTEESDGNQNINDQDRLVLGSNTKKDYYIGDDFVSPTVFLIYKDGTNKNVSDSSNLKISGYDMNTAGAYTVDVKYSEPNISVSTSYSIAVYNAAVKKLEVKCSQEELIWGEYIDKSKLEVTAIYTNLRSEIVDDYKLKYNSMPDSFGPIDVTVTYKDVSAVFQINVVEKVIDEQYLDIKNEAIKLLNRFGVENPTSPKDYKLEIGIEGKPRIRFSGSLNSELTTSEQQYAYLTTVIFYDYQLEGEIVDTYEMIFPSKKAVFSNLENDFLTTIYVSSLMGEVKYSIIIQ